MTKKLVVPPAMRLGQVIDEYLRLRLRKEIAENTVRCEKSLLRQFAARIGGDPWMSQISAAAVEDFFYGKGGVGDRRAPASFNIARSRMNSFFKYCQARGLLHTDLMYQVDRKREPEREQIRLTADQLQRSLDMTKWPRDRIAVAISLSTLLRASEIVEIRVGQVELDAGFIRVWKQKTQSWDRMPISGDLDPELRGWLTFYTTECGPLQDDWYLVPAQWFMRWGKGGTVEPRMRLRPEEKPSTPHLIVKRALENAGIEVNGRKGFHTFRRSMAALFLDQQIEAGEDGAMLMTQALLGHKNITTTQIYTGYESPRRRRDKAIRGMPMLSSMVSNENVVPLRAVKGE
jgi:integrase